MLFRCRDSSQSRNIAIKGLEDKKLKKLRIFNFYKINCLVSAFLFLVYKKTKTINTPMKKSSTPNSDSKKNILTKKFHFQYTAPKSLVTNIMAYVNSTKELNIAQLGNVKLFLN